MPVVLVPPSSRRSSTRRPSASSPEARAGWNLHPTGPCQVCSRTSQARVRAPSASSMSGNPRRPSTASPRSSFRSSARSASRATQRYIPRSHTYPPNAAGFIEQQRGHRLRRAATARRRQGVCCCIPVPAATRADDRFGRSARHSGLLSLRRDFPDAATAPDRQHSRRSLSPWRVRSRPGRQGCSSTPGGVEAPGDGQRRMPETSACQLPAAIRSWLVRSSPAV